MAAKYSPQQALELIRKILNEGGYISPSKRHAKRDRMPERDVDMQDIEILLLETGSIKREPEWDDETSLVLTCLCLSYEYLGKHSPRAYNEQQQTT